MQAALVCIGDEILSGQIVNTNAAYLAARLTEEGFSVQTHVVTSDFDPDNELLFKTLAEKMDLIICSGGLGPTVDDMTRYLFAKLSSSELVFNASIEADLTERFAEHSYHRLQAMVPAKAQLLANASGHASGLVITVNRALIVALPGVPHEMKMMFEKELMPRLRQEFSSSFKYYDKTLHFFDLNETAVDAYIVPLKEAYPHLIWGLYPSYGTLKLTFKGPSLQDLEHVAREVKEAFKKHLFDAASLEEALFNRLKRKNLHLALAESITGGALAARLVALPGISSHFLGSCVVYTNELKIALLDVHPAVLNSYGAVSQETTELMLAGLFAKTKAGVSCAVTGFAGPTGESIGLVYISIGFKENLYKTYTCRFSGDRPLIIEKAATYALGYLVQALDEF